MRKLAVRLLIKWLLADFSITERQLMDEEYASAMQQYAESPQLKKYHSILVGNMIRRHLYIHGMDEGEWYLGAIAAIRKIQTDSEKYMQNKEKRDLNIEKT